MARFQGQVQIARPVDEVFDAYTDARLSAAQADTRTDVAFTHVVEDGPGTQAVWTFIHPDMKTEMVETVFEIDRPHRIASHLRITRVMALEPHEVTPGVMPQLAYDLGADYSPIYGRLPVEGVLQCSFTAQDGGTVLEVVTEMKLGGVSRIAAWVAARSKRHPMQADLEAFRDRLEAGSDASGIS